MYQDYYQRNLKELRECYVDALVFVVVYRPEPCFSGKGRVQSVDENGQLHGTWGDIAVDPQYDRIEKL